MVQPSLRRARTDDEADWLEVQSIRGDHEQGVPETTPALSETHRRLVTDHSETVSSTDSESAGLDDTTAYQEFGVGTYFNTAFSTHSARFGGLEP